MQDKRGKKIKKIDPTKEASKIRLSNKFAKNDLNYVTRYPEDWVSDLELLIGDLRKLGFIIDDVEIMTHILSNLPEEYENIFENLEKELDYYIDMLTIKIIWDKLSAKYDSMNVESNQTEGKES